MGCGTPRACASLGLLKSQPKVSLLLTMIFLFTYFFYCLTGYCEPLPSPVYLKQQPDELRLRPQTGKEFLLPVIKGLPGSSHLPISGTQFPEPINPGDGNSRQEEEDEDASSSMSVSNNFGTKKFPQAVIIGVRKGGTRALLEFLRIHPDVRAVGAEPHFFDRFYDRGFEWYRNLMPRTLDGQITMEKTPSYFVTKEAPHRIHNMSKDTKLIVVVRNPVTRAISDYTQILTKNPTIPSFQDLAFKNISTGLIDTSWSAIRIGIYSKHLENWLQYFPLSKFLFVSGERLVTDPSGEMGRVQSFLGLKSVITDKHFYFNETKGFPCLKKPEGSSRPRCLGKTKGRPHPKISDDVMQRLQEFYRPFNMKFYQMTGQDFGWG